MSRRWPVFLTFAAALGGAVVLPSVASAAPHGTPPAAACTADTQQVKDLTTAVTALGTALKTTPPDPATISKATGDVITAVSAAQGASCLPALPSATTPTPPTPPKPSTSGTSDPTKCLADTVQLQSAGYDILAAGTATTPDPAAVLKSATDLATAITALNTDTCLPAALPVPSVPSVPTPAPPVS